MSRIEKKKKKNGDSPRAGGEHETLANDLKQVVKV